MLPLIDVVFLLLVFFIYAFLSMVLHRGLNVDLPTANTAPLNQQDYIDVSITADNEIFVNRQKVSMGEVSAAIRLVRKSEDEPIFINGDRQAGLGIAVELLDILRQDGIQKVSFACKDEK